MPKRRKAYPNAKPTAPAHPSLSSEKAKATEPSQHSVNDKLQQLRLEQLSSSKRSLSPTERPLYTRLQTPFVSPSLPSGAIHGPRRNRRGPPGPPPPSSWLQKPATVDKQQYARSGDLSQVELKPLDGTKLPSHGSLQDRCLRALACDWANQVYINQFNLACLDVKTKETLCYYVARYKPGGMTAEALHVLFLDDGELEYATGAEGLRRLDLGGSIHLQLQLDHLEQYLVPPLSPAPQHDQTPDDIPDAWDEVPSPPTSLGHHKFKDLTHLSLAYPHPGVKFTSLLKLAPFLTSVTHLSLAGWPKPCLRPNSVTASFSTPMGDVQSSLGTFYSDLDNDYSEPAHALRRLGKHLTGLKWLDLSGCWPWVKCLAEQAMDWSSSSLETLVLNQGILPRLLRNMPEDPDEWALWFIKTCPPITASMATDAAAAAAAAAANKKDKDDLCTYLRTEYEIQHLERKILDSINGVLPKFPSFMPTSSSSTYASTIQAINSQYTIVDGKPLSSPTTSTSTSSTTNPTRNNKPLRILYASKNDEMSRKIQFARRHMGVSDPFLPPSTMTGGGGGGGGPQSLSYYVNQLNFLSQQNQSRQRMQLAWEAWEREGDVFDVESVRGVL